MPCEHPQHGLSHHAFPGCDELHPSLNWKTKLKSSSLELRKVTNDGVLLGIGEAMGQQQKSLPTFQDLSFSDTLPCIHKNSPVSSTFHLMFGLNENGSYVWMLDPHLRNYLGRIRKCGLAGGDVSQGWALRLQNLPPSPVLYLSLFLLLTDGLLGS